MKRNDLTELALAIIEAERRGISLVPQGNVLQQYFDDPEGFIKNCITWPNGESPAEYQLKVISSISSEKRVCVRGPHGVGKTTIAALAVWWFALTREAVGVDWKVITTASVWRQLTKYLWPEIHKWARHIKWDKIGRPAPTYRELGILAMRLTYGEAFAAASTDPGNIEGAHASQLLYIFDEAKIVPDATFDAAEGAFAAGQAYGLAISTPGAPRGRFYEIQSRAPGFEDWWTYHITKEAGIESGRLNQQWVDQRRLQWGETSAVYQTRVEGNFAQERTSTIIPLEWIEIANERWHEFQKNRQNSVLTTIGVDVGHGTSTSDNATIATCYNGYLIDDVRTVQIHDSRLATMELVGAIGAVLKANPQAEAIIDVIGIGDGVYARALELGYRVRAHNAAFRTDLTDISGIYGFDNWRAAGWWLLRELLDPNNNFEVALPPHDILIGELTMPQFSYSSKSKIVVESKDKIRKRLYGKSTDYADAVIHALIGPLLCDERASSSIVQTETRLLPSVVY